MESIISIFHIDFKLIIAQIINFAIIVFVLYFFVIKPVSKTMKERTSTIEKSLEEAKAIGTNLKQSEQEKETIIREARISAEQIIKKSELISHEERQKSITSTKEEVKKLLEDGKNQLEKEKDKIVLEIKSQIADLVILATSKVLNQKADEKINKDLVNNVLEQIQTKDKN